MKARASLRLCMELDVKQRCCPVVCAVGVVGGAIMLGKSRALDKSGDGIGG